MPPTADSEPKLPVRDLMQKNLAVYSMSLAGVPHPDRKRAQTDIAAWTASPGRILSVAARFPLYETAAAHKAVEAGGKVGTIIVSAEKENANAEQRTERRSDRLGVR